MTARAIEVHMLAGVPCVVIRPGATAADLAGLLRWTNDMRTRSGRLPLPAATDLASALRYVVQVDDLIGSSVPVAEQGVASDAVAREDLISTTDAARLLGLGERGVRQRIKRGQLPAHRVGRTWLIRLDDLRDERIAS